MNGLEAISANNGWSIAAVGIIIVFAGLVILSTIISQLHKVLAFIENPKKFEFFSSPKSNDKTDELVLTPFKHNQKESAKQFSLLVKTMEEHFSLPKLVRLAEISNLEKPYDNINNLLDSGIVEPDSKGYFLWNEDRYKQLTK
ncbi:MAG: OadG family protein [Desulfobacteraceae bacterium]|nr:OadG family protein [Desulfobacteraceae bacterium]